MAADVERRGTGRARYTYRARVSATAQTALEAEWARCRWVWNESRRILSRRRLLTGLGAAGLAAAVPAAYYTFARGGTAPLLGQPLTGHDGVAHSVAFSPDGKILATGSGDKTVRLRRRACRIPTSRSSTTSDHLW